MRTIKVILQASQLGCDSVFLTSGRRQASLCQVTVLLPGRVCVLAASEMLMIFRELGN